MNEMKREAFVSLVNNVVHDAMGLKGIEIAENVDVRCPAIHGLPKLSAFVSIKIDDDDYRKALVNGELNANGSINLNQDNFYVKQILKSFGDITKGFIFKGLEFGHKRELESKDKEIEELKSKLKNVDEELIGKKAVIKHLEKTGRIE